MPDDSPDTRDDGPAVAPEPDDRPPMRDPESPPDAKEAGATGWEAIAPPGKPDGEVDTRP